MFEYVINKCIFKYKFKNILRNYCFVKLETAENFKHKFNIIAVQDITC